MQKLSMGCRDWAWDAGTGVDDNFVNLRKIVYNTKVLITIILLMLA